MTLKLFVLALLAGCFVQAEEYPPVVIMHGILGNAEKSKPVISILEKPSLRFASAMCVLFPTDMAGCATFSGRGG